MSTKAIEKFLRRPEEGGAYDDAHLAMLLAHAEDGKLAFNSCCCLLGVSNAVHALRGSRSYGPQVELDEQVNHHLKIRLSSHLAEEAEYEFSHLGVFANSDQEADAQRRERLIPLIRAEIARRDALKAQVTCESRDSIATPELAGVLT